MLDGDTSTTKIDVIILGVPGDTLCIDARQHNVAEVSNKTQSNCNSFHRDWQVPRDKEIKVFDLTASKVSFGWINNTEKKLIQPKIMNTFFPAII